MLISLLVAVVVAGLLFWVATLLPIPQPFKNIALIIVALILIYWIASVGGVPLPN